jgi:hypothetical protein
VSYRPRWLLLMEWPRRPDIDDVGDKLRERFGARITDCSHFVGYRLYPWADQPQVLPPSTPTGEYRNK